MRSTLLPFLIVCFLGLISCKGQPTKELDVLPPSQNSNYQHEETNTKIIADTLITLGLQIANAAESLTQDPVIYDPSYFVIPYPNGDIPEGKGVCTDVVIRTYRKMGVDLQKEVHEDMKSHFSKYPKIWGLSKTDTNIDHRRVPNLMKFFERKGASLSITQNPEEYKSGDVVAWRLPNNLTHIGVVSSHISDKGIPLIIHNIGTGQVEEDCLFSWKIIGHYRYHTETPIMQ